MKRLLDCSHEMAARNDAVTKTGDIQKKWLLMRSLGSKVLNRCVE